MAQQQQIPCAAPAKFSRIEPWLGRTARRLAAGEPVTIVAIGSSSTAGAGASSPKTCYPSRLEAELKRHFPRAEIRVINRGVNGEEAKEMLARFDQSVIAEKPDLVLWQVGTNAVLRDRNLLGEAPLIRSGIRRLKETGADVVLIDPQFAPQVIVKPDAERMVQLIDETARDEGVGVFHRYELMQHWNISERIPFDTFVSPDGLHMNDWGYDCIARALAQGIADAATRISQSASAEPR